MTQRITLILLSLSLLLSLVLWHTTMENSARAAMQANYPLIPANFTSLGASPFGAAGIYTIDASKNNANPILTKPDMTTITGVFFNSTGGEIAVFTFDSINIPANVTVKGAQNANSRPIALLSQGAFTMSGVIDVSGANGMSSNIANFGGDGGNAGPGGGGGGAGGGLPTIIDNMVVTPPGKVGLGFVNGSQSRFGGAGGSVMPGGGGKGGNSAGGGGAFGGHGGKGNFGLNTDGAGGTAYGDLLTSLQGGSGGAGSTAGNSGPGCNVCVNVGAGGGGGGGAVELGAVGTLTIGGTVSANGGNGADANIQSGGGAGGGILIHAPTVTQTGQLQAKGGNGLVDGGGGGGGRVTVLAPTCNLTPANINVSGGGPSGRAGGIGVSGSALAFSQQPTDTLFANTITPPIQVRLLDGCGNLMTNSNAAVTLALGANPGSGTLSGTTTVNAASGVATFSDLSINKVGTGYTLVATTSGLPGATSSPFNITSNSPPTINVMAITRTAGSSASNVKIATVNDAQDEENTLGITATPATGSGVALNGISVDTSGNVTATITASCSATTSTFTLKVTDSGMLPAETTLTVNITADATPPDTNIINSPPSTSDGNVGFSFTGSDNCSNTVTFECQLDGGGWSACTSPKSYTNLPGGAHTFEVRAKDAQNNVDASPAQYLWTVFTSSCSTVVNPATLPSATRGTPFAQTLSASPTGSYVFSVLSGTLPLGLSLVNVLGIYSLRGTPTTAGTYSFTIKAKKNNSTCEGARTYTIVVP